MDDGPTPSPHSLDMDVRAICGVYMGERRVAEDPDAKKCRQISSFTAPGMKSGIRPGL